MTTKSKSSTIKTLDLGDLDGIVGGAVSAAPVAQPHDPSQDHAFLATLGNVAAVVSQAAAVAHSNAQVAIGEVESAAQAQHISTTAALTDLLGATHGNQAVATALATSLVDGSAAKELVQLVDTGHLQAADVDAIVTAATGTLAAYSVDGHSALGMSQNAAIDVIDAKISTAAHSQAAADLASASLKTDFGSVGRIAESAVNAFAKEFDATHAAQLSTEATIEKVVTAGHTTTFQADLNAAASNPLEAQSSTLFGEKATIVEAFSGQASAGLVDQIVSSNAVVEAIASVEAGRTLSTADLSTLEKAASEAHISTDLTLAVAETLSHNAAVQQTLVTEMDHRIQDNAMETDLATLVRNSQGLTTAGADTLIDTVVQAVTSVTLGVGNAAGFGNQLDPTVVSQAAAVAHSNAQMAISEVELAAQAQHISTTAALTDLLGATHGNQAVATALATSLVDGSAAKELVQLVDTGHLQAADVDAIVTAATGTLAAYSVDGHSALGMSQNAAIDVIDAKISTAAHSQAAADLASASLKTDFGSVGRIAESAVNAFAKEFDATHAAQLSTEATIEKVVTAGHTTTFQADLNAAASNPLEAQSSTLFGEKATIVEAFSGQASAGLVDQIVSSNAVVEAIASVEAGRTLSTADLSTLEKAASEAHISTDLTLAVAETLSHNAAVQQTLVTEMDHRIQDNAMETDLATLVRNSQGLTTAGADTLIDTVVQAVTSVTLGVGNAAGFGNQLDPTVVSQAAAVAHSNAQMAISEVESAAQAQHISTTAALTDLLGATHGNQAVATALATSLVDGSAAKELVQLVDTGHLQAADVDAIVTAATGTLAAYSVDGHSALGMSQNAAIDVIDAKISTAAHSQAAADLASASLKTDFGSVGRIAESAVNAFAKEFDATHAAQLSTEATIEKVVTAGHTTTFQADLNAAASNPLEAQSSTLFGEKATIVEAFSGQASAGLVDQIVSSNAVVEAIASVEAGRTLSTATLSTLEKAASEAHISTDLTLAVAETLSHNAAVQQTLVTEMDHRIQDNAMETDLATLVRNSQGLTTAGADTLIDTVVQAVTGVTLGAENAADQDLAKKPS